MHPPDPETSKGALAGAPNRVNLDTQPVEITAPDRQAQHLRRLYFVSFDAARIVAELAFGVAR